MTRFTCPCGGQVVGGGEAPAGGGQCLACAKVFESPAAVIAAGGGWVQLCGGRGRRPTLHCQEPECTRDTVALCDEPTEGRRTCDRRVCSQHRTRVGANRDRCPAHALGAEVCRG